VKLGVRIIHRIINLCTTARLKTGVAYYTRVRIILEILRYISCVLEPKLLSSALDIFGQDVPFIFQQDGARAILIINA